MMKRTTAAGALALAALAWSTAAQGSALDEARALREEGLKILKAARQPGGDLHAGSIAALEKFEGARAKVEGAAEGTPAGELQTDLNSLIFWTRRTMPLDLFGGSGPASRAPASPAEKKPEPEKKPAADLTVDAEAAYARAESYAKSNPDDHVSVAARFFALADKYKDVHDVAFKAISRAQHFQRVARAKADAAKGLREGAGPDEKLVVEGDRAYAAGRFDAAAAKYSEAIAAKATAGRHRKLGHARFERAQQYRDEYIKVYRRELKNYSAARRRKDRGGMRRAADRAKAASAVAQKGIAKYQEACSAFESAWKMSEKLDIDSEVHMALTYIIRKEPFYRNKARTLLERVLRTYHDKLKTDEERTLYAHAETYAGEATAARIKAQIARSARAAAATREPEEGGESRIAAMKDEAIVDLIGELKDALRRDEAKLRQKQAMGQLDKSLYDSVRQQKKQLEALTAEAEKRGLEL